MREAKAQALCLVFRRSKHLLAVDIFLKNYKRSENQLPDSSAKLINEIMFHPSSELFTGCPSKHVSKYKLSTICYSFLSDTASVYLSDLLCVYFLLRQLRSSSDSRALRIPHIKTKRFGHRSFSHATSSVWNSLPHEIRHIQSTTAFKTALKTHLLKLYIY